MKDPYNENLVYNVALSLIPKVGTGIYKSIVSYFGSAVSFFEMPTGKAKKIPGVGDKLLSLLKEKSNYLAKAEKIIQEAQKNKITIHCLMDGDFPARLKSSQDSPVILYSMGNIELQPERTIGIVGTRNASDYGKYITRKIVEDLAPYKPTIISGLAYGIDIEAHKAALEFGLPTIGVLGTPLDKIYPAIHKSIAMKMMEKGGLVTEYRIGSELNASNFPQRNRIIAGLSDALIVVEAAKKGGALITAGIAYSYNKEVFAVPGNLNATYSEGCNNLIRTMKAGIYTGPKELEEALSWNKGASKKEAKTPEWKWEEFEPNEQVILKIILEDKELEIDKLSWKSGISLSALASLLLNLEFKGTIKSLPGKKYRIVQ